MKNILLLIVTNTFIVLGCTLRHSPKMEAGNNQKEDINMVVIQFVEDLIFTTISIDCEVFENSFSRELYKERIIQDRILIDSLLYILHNLEPVDTIYPWTSVNTRATIMLYSNKDTVKYCLDDGIVFHLNSYYKTTEELSVFTGIDWWNRETKYKKVDVNIINAIDSAFYRVLDEILQYESRHSYYSNTLSYGIWIHKVPIEQEDSVIVLSISVYSEKEIFIDNEHLLGSLSYKGHDFFIRGRDILPAIIVTDNKKSFICREYYPVLDDDRWAGYTFFYYENNFILYAKSN